MAAAMTDDKLELIYDGGGGRVTDADDSSTAPVNTAAAAAAGTRWRLAANDSCDASVLISLLARSQSTSSIHRYECVALCKDISLQRGRCARSLASCIARSSEDRSS